MARKNKKKKTLAFKNAVAGYLFIAPFIIGFILFLVVPLVQSLRMSFSTVELEGGLSMTWAGLENYRQAFLVDEQFVPNLISELVKMLTNVPATLIFSFFIALLLNQSFKGRGAVRAIFFLPVILSSGVIVGLESGNTLLADMKDAIEATNNNTSITGVLESILITSDSSPMSQMFSYVFDIINSVYDIAIASGIQIIIFLSALQTISPSMFEAAKIEGCTAWESFWKITLPMVSSMILVNIVYTVIDFFLKTDNTVMDRIDAIGIGGRMDYGQASAMAWVYFLCVIVALGIVSLIIYRKSNGYLLRKVSFNVAYKIVRFVLLFGLCFLILQPLLNKISISFMEERDLYDSTINVIPRHFTLDNFKIAADLMDYWAALGNTLWISLLVSILQIISCTLVGYGFARYKFPLKNLWFAMVVLVIVIPPSTIQSSLYLNFRYFDIFGIFSLITGQPLNLLDSFAPYAFMCLGCMGLKNGLYIYMLRQFFRGIPKELEEAAYVDGCGKVKTFVRIMLPDAKPMITSCFLFSFVWQWTDSFYSGMFLPNYSILANKVARLSEVLNSYVKATTGLDKASTAYASAMIGTGTLLVIIPLIIVYLFAQKGFVESLSQSGIKM